MSERVHVQCLCDKCRDEGCWSPTVKRVLDAARAYEKEHGHNQYLLNHGRDVVDAVRGLDALDAPRERYTAAWLDDRWRVIDRVLDAARAWRRMWAVIGLGPDKDLNRSQEMLNLIDAIDGLAALDALRERYTNGSGVDPVYDTVLKVWLTVGDVIALLNAAERAK